MALFRMKRREDLPAKLERVGTALSQSAAEKGSETSRRVADILRRASDDISSVAEGSYRDRVMNAMGMARSRMSDGADMMKDRVREHPLASVALAVGIGIMLGAVIGAIGSRAAAERY